MKNSMEIEVIKTSHDAEDSVGYIVTSNDKSIVYVTDTGYIKDIICHRHFCTGQPKPDRWILPICKKQPDICWENMIFHLSGQMTARPNHRSEPLHVWIYQQFRGLMFTPAMMIVRSDKSTSKGQLFLSKWYASSWAH